LELLTALLDDVLSDLRAAAGEALVELANDESVRNALGQRLAELLESASPRQTKGALLVLGTLDYEPAADAILALLGSPEPSVSQAAAWALERLAVPATADQILSVVVNETERTIAEVEQLAPAYAENPEPDVELPNFGPTYERVEHLILALGKIRHEPASQFLRQFVPKPVWQVRGEPPSLETFKQPRLRAATIWALGKIHEGRTDASLDDLADALVERMSDTTPIPREEPLVRQMAAISLGRLGRDDKLPAIREFFDPNAAHDDVGRACGWAIEHLTGTPPEVNATREVRHVDWFLVPLN
jgi:HEAT repeat protein